ncbi:MAG: SDR family NAD(P)-dependent oxidoreductase [Fimbriimonadaceae bacterium]
MASRRVLVTGSSRGIGRAIALRLGIDGWQVAVHCGENAEAAKSVAAGLGPAAAGVYRANLCEPGAAASLWKAALDDGPVHALVNNAGIYRPLSLLQATDDEFDACLVDTFAVNWEAPLRLTRYAGKTFSAAGGGKILNVASRVGFRGEAGAALYSASKAALINLTRAAAVEFAPKGVFVAGIAPGWAETAMVRDGMESRIADIVATIPLGRMASPDDCAASAAFLLRDEAAYLSGVVIDINGASYFH